MLNVPEIFKSEDIIFHYCPMNTAIEHILYGKTLRLASRKDSIDPMEKIKPLVAFGGYFNQNEEFIDSAFDKNRELVDYIRNLTNGNFDKCKQVCFCMNDSSNSKTDGEYYGFLKPRMWDQYADSYKGVCLAFSLKELRKKEKLSHGKINYIGYDSLETDNYDIDLNRLSSMDAFAYMNEYFERFQNLFLRKHIDYAGENEYRFFTTSDDEYHYIDIKDCINGIIFSWNYSSQFSHNVLMKYADDLNIELLRIVWDSSGILLRDKNALKEQIRLMQIERESE